MQHFKDENDKVHCFEDDVTSEWISANRPTLVSITESDADELRFGDEATLVAKAKVIKNAYLTTQCAVDIVGGFTSNAIDAGQAYGYDSRDVDQTNLDHALIAAQHTGSTFAILCNNPSGQDGFMYRDHTEAQIKEVIADFATFRLGKSQTLTLKLAEVNAATTVAEVEAISW